MKIGIYGGSLLPIHAGSLNERPLGGMETAVIYLAKHLSLLGNEVLVFSKNPKQLEGEGPRYLPLEHIENLSELDVFISVRDWIPLFFRVPSKLRLFWTGDSYDQYPNYGIGDRRVASRIDLFLAKSQWQADQICERSGFPREKVYILRNGVELQRFKNRVEKKRNRLIYSSTPYRGLEFVPALYRFLKAKHPEIELRIFSSYKIYDQNHDFEKLKSELRALPDCHYSESILQSELTREFLEAGILFYPCHFEETSCTTAIEAMAAGCAIVTSALGALPETIGNAGLLIEGRPPEASYISSFVKSMDRLLNDSSFFDSLSAAAKERAQIYDWPRIAKDFDDYLRKRLK